ncbi:MAG: hypothetical protein MZV64_19665 [Ignavibacteriales bacterium]|nr:hypothetical protein [Ignavibacteriales bacterium]
MTREMELEPKEHLPIERVDDDRLSQQPVLRRGLYQGFYAIAPQDANAPAGRHSRLKTRLSREHALPLSTSYTPAGSLYLADLWYYPQRSCRGCGTAGDRHASARDWLLPRADLHGRPKR